MRKQQFILLFKVYYFIFLKQARVDRDKPRNLEIVRWFMDFFYGLWMTQSYQLDHSLSQRLS